MFNADDKNHLSIIMKMKNGKKEKEEQRKKKGKKETAI
jgi:hypothetical protein